MLHDARPHTRRCVASAPPALPPSAQHESVPTVASARCDPFRRGHVSPPTTAGAARDERYSRYGHLPPWDGVSVEEESLDVSRHARSIRNDRALYLMALPQLDGALQLKVARVDTWVGRRRNVTVGRRSHAGCCFYAPSRLGGMR